MNGNLDKYQIVLYVDPNLPNSNIKRYVYEMGNIIVNKCFI